MEKQSSMNGWIAFASAATFVIGATLAASTLADGDDDDDDGGRTFSDRSVEGSWGWSGAGTLVSPEDGEALPTVGLGITTFDGEGGCTVTSTVNVNGLVFGPITSESCSYSVDPDGSGSSLATFSDPPISGDASVTFVIVDRGRELRFIQHDEFVVTFTAKRL